MSQGNRRGKARGLGGGFASKSQAVVSGLNQVLLSQKWVETIVQMINIRKSMIRRYPRSNEGHTDEEESRTRSSPLRLGFEAGDRMEERNAYMSALSDSI